jgi:tetratricopeptide (TPR) repeat protein
MIAFWYCLKAYEKPSAGTILLIFFFFILGIYSKRTSAIFIGIVPLSMVLFRKVNLKLVAAALGIVIGSIVITTLIKKMIVTEQIVRKFYSFENAMLVEKASLFEKLMATVKTLGFYIKFSFIPYPFRNYYGTNVVDLTTKPDLNLFLGVAFLGGSIWYYLKSKNKIFLYGFLLFMGGIFPFANLIIPVAGVVGERLAYNASFGIAVMASALILPLFSSVQDFSFGRLFKKPALYFMPVILAYTVIIWMRNANWKDKVTLFEHDIEHLELSAKANSMLGNEYFEQLRTGKSRYTPQVLISKALNHYQLAIKNDSSFYSAYNNAGVLYFSYLQNLPEAERYLLLSFKVRPVYPQAYENLGNLYRHQNRTEEALKAYIKSISQNPKQYSAYISAIKLCYVDKQYEKALGICRVAQTYFPNDYSLIGQEADCLFMLNRKKEALEKYEEAYNLTPSKELAAYLSAQYLELGDTAKSNEYKSK